MIGEASCGRMSGAGHYGERLETRSHRNGLTSVLLGALPSRRSLPVYGKSSFIGSKAGAPVRDECRVACTRRRSIIPLRGEGWAALRADAHTDAIMDRLVAALKTILLPEHRAAA